MWDPEEIIKHQKLLSKDNSLTCMVANMSWIIRRGYARNCSVTNLTTRVVRKSCKILRRPFSLRQDMEVDSFAVQMLLWCSVFRWPSRPTNTWQSSKVDEDKVLQQPLLGCPNQPKIDGDKKLSWDALTQLPQCIPLQFLHIPWGQRNLFLATPIFCHGILFRRGGNLRKLLP